MQTLRSHRLALGILFVICALVAYGKLAFIGTTESGDYKSYIESAQALAGLPAAPHPERLLKPLAPLGTTLLAPITGDFPSAFILEVLIGYFALALVLYLLGYDFFGRKKQALAFALLAALSYPVLRYGVDLYTETGALFFYIASLLLTLRYLKAPSKKLIVANALVISLGFLWKEYSVVNAIIFGLLLLTERIAPYERIKNIALFIAAGLPLSLLVQAWVYLSYHYTYLNWYLDAAANSSGFEVEFTLKNIVKSFAALLGLAWLFVPLGAWRFKALEPYKRRFLIFAIIPPFIAPLWEHVSSRIFYPIAPAFLLLAILGIWALPKWLRAPVVALALILNVVALVVLAT